MELLLKAIAFADGIGVAAIKLQAVMQAHLNTLNKLPDSPEKLLVMHSFKQVLEANLEMVSVIKNFVKDEPTTTQGENQKA